MITPDVPAWVLTWQELVDKGICTEEQVKAKFPDAITGKIIAGRLISTRVIPDSGDDPHERFVIFPYTGADEPPGSTPGGEVTPEVGATRMTYVPTIASMTHPPRAEPPT